MLCQLGGVCSIVAAHISLCCILWEAGILFLWCRVQGHPRSRWVRPLPVPCRHCWQLCMMPLQAQLGSAMHHGWEIVLQPEILKLKFPSGHCQYAAQSSLELPVQAAHLPQQISP